MVAAIDTWAVGLIYLVSAMIITWTAGALFYDVGRASKAAWVLVFLWMGVVVTPFVVWLPLWKPFLLLLAAFGLFLLWWFSQQPSNDRNWEPSAAVLAKVEIRGDRVTIDNVRNIDTRTPGSHTPCYQRRTYHLSKLCGIDCLICFWGSPWMSHPIFVFDFGTDGRVCFSIEVRYQKGQKYNLLSSLYRQHELIYHICDERDVLLQRTKYSQGQDVYLYQIFATDSEVRRFFMEYVKQVNTLIEQPRWYHGLTTNCTTSIYSQREDPMLWDWRLLFNGNLDKMLYDRERLDRSLPFKDLKHSSWVNEIANRAPQGNFGDYVRSELSAYRPKPTTVEHSTTTG